MLIDYLSLIVSVGVTPLLSFGLGHQRDNVTVHFDENLLLFDQFLFNLQLLFTRL